MLAIEKMILIVLLLICLITALYLLLGLGKGTADQVLLQNELRGCCGYYRASDCQETGIICDQDDHSIEVLKNLLRMDDTQLKLFCNCPQV